MICSVFPHLAHYASAESCQKFPHAGWSAGKDRRLPVLLRSEQVVNLPGHPSRQAPPAAAGAQTRRACFRGFNPQVSGLSSAVAESPGGRCRARRRGVPDPAASPTALPPTRLLPTRGGRGERRPPPRRARPSDAAAPQPQPNGFPDADSRVPRRLSPPSPAAPRRRKADPLACLVRGSGSSSHYLDGGPGSRGPPLRSR